MRKMYFYMVSLLACLLMVPGLKAAAQTWDFTVTSAADVENLSADTDNWTYESGNNRYKSVPAYTGEALTANGQELALTSGLLFTTTEADAIRIDVNRRFILNRVSTITIPSLKAGTVVTVECKSSSSSTARSLTATNITVESGFGTESTSQLTCKGTVTADGDVTLSNSGGMYFYSISVANAGESGSDTPVASSDNSVSFNAQKNQVRVHVGSDIKYYNTDEVSVSMDEAEGTVTVAAQDGSWQDVYTQSVTSIDFALAESTGSEGEIQNQGIVITEAKGWRESLYAKWEPYADATSYNVYVKGGRYADYTQIDQQLVRDYGTYGRADVVGLVAGGDYAIKVVAVDANGSEIAASASEAINMNVINYSREGFAHFNRTEGVGACNNDGSLKSGAKVFHVTASTAKTISTTVQTSSSKSETFTGLQAIINAYQKGCDTTPIAFRIIGTVDGSDLDDMLSGEGLQIKGKNSYSTLNITIEGIGEDATLTNCGFLLRNASSVELRNFAIIHCLDDCVSIDTDNSNLWIHNLDLFYGQKGGASDQAKGDGTVDIKGDSRYITVDNNRFWDSGKASMCGMTSETGPNYITYHHNWFDHSDSRHARVRTMSVHMYNNYFDHNDVYGIGVTSGSSLFADRNYFNVAYRPMMSSKQGTDAKGNGTFSGEDGGVIKAYGNIMTNKTSNFSYVPYSDNNTSFDAYEVSSPTEQVPSSVVALVGGTPYDNFDTSASLMYAYQADDAADVPAVVTGYYGAGRLNHGDIVYEIPDETYTVNGHHQPWPELDELLTNYKSSLVKIFGDESASSGETGSDSGSGDTGSDTGSDSGSDTGGDTGSTETSGTITCSFGNKTWTNSDFFTITGNTSDSKGSVTVNGETYTYCLKMESKTNISFTITEQMTMNLYFGDAGSNIKVNDTKYAADDTTFILTQVLEAGTYTLTKADTCNLFYIELIPTATAE